MTDQNSNSLVSGVTYNAANKPPTLSGTVVAESRTYDRAPQNSGRIQSVISGETVTCAYLTINLLMIASGTGDAQGSCPRNSGMTVLAIF